MTLAHENANLILVEVVTVEAEKFVDFTPLKSRGKVKICGSFVFKNLGDCSDTQSFPALNFWIFISFMVCSVVLMWVVVKML